MNLTAYGNEKKKILLLGDIVLVGIAFLVAVFTKAIFFSSYEVKNIFTRMDLLFILWIMLYPLSFYVFELYDRDTWQQNLRLLTRIILSVVTVSVLSAFLFYVFMPHFLIGRVILCVHAVLLTIIIFLWRKVFIERISGNKNIKIILLGKSSFFDDNVITHLEKRRLPLESVVTISEYSENPGNIILNGTSTSLTELAKTREVDAVVVAENLNKFPLLKKQLIDLRFSGVKIFDAPYFYEALTGKVPLDYIKDTRFIFYNQGKPFNAFTYRRIKKIMDRFLAVTGLLISVPLMMFIAVLIKIDSRGPVFFKQERLGQNEKPFTLIKFRTMVEDAEKLTGPKWASKDDPRITRVGRLLRKTRLDELPQLFNVLKGEMSFVGPRPIRKYFADLLAEEIPYYRLRFLVKPGLSGWAQVKGDYAGSKMGQKEKLEFDLYYIQNQSILFDFFIILKTFQTVLFRRGQ